MRCPHLGRQRSSPGTTIQFQFQLQLPLPILVTAASPSNKAAEEQTTRSAAAGEQEELLLGWVPFTPFLNSVLRCGSCQKLPEGGIEPSSLPGLPGNQQKQPLYASWARRGILEKPIEGAGRQLAGSRKPPKAPFSPPTSRAPEATTPPPLMLAI